ncbi:hypothetical protein [uncultured Paraglaciecola sp.]|uniref:hypothetical protein n=1 Tax=uncultured Paraglaciecola sp. TaxID=1765024 RepID=UPI0030D9558E|tara:strand:- start:56293 stop:56469 length:177 start_codon:yes stop_codon:yes gene_type:complete
MLLKVFIVIVIVTVGFLLSVTSLGSGGFITTFLVAFGLFSVIALVGLIMFANKNKPKE